MNQAVAQPDSRAWFNTLIGVLGGGATALVVCFDWVFTRYHPLNEIDGFDAGTLVYPWTLTAVALVALGFAASRAHRVVFAHRYAVAVVAIIAACALTGLNIGPIDPVDLVLVLAFGFWAISSMVEMRPVQTPRVVLLLLSVIALASVASMINGRFSTILSLHTVFGKLVMLFVLTNFIASHWQQRLAVRAFIAVSAATAVLAIASEVVYLSTGYPITFDDNPGGRFKDTPLGEMLRASVFMTSSQTMAHMLILAMCLALFEPMRRRTRLALLAVMTAGVLCTFSFGAYLAMFMMYVLSLFVRRPQKTPSYLVFGLLIFGALYVSGLGEKLKTEVFEPIGLRNAMERVEYMRIGMHAVEHHPYLGVGLGNGSRVLHTPVHNAYIQSAVDIGIPAAAALVLLMGYLAVRCATAMGRTTDPERRARCKGPLLGMIVMGIHFMSEPFYNNIVSWVFMGVVAASICVLDPHNKWIEANDG